MADRTMANGHYIFGIERGGKLLWIVCETPAGRSLYDSEEFGDALFYAVTGRKPRVDVWPLTAGRTAKEADRGR